MKKKTHPLTKYYFSYNFNYSPPNPLTLNRWYETKDVLFTEQWTGKEWIDNSNLVASTEIGGDLDYLETTEEEAYKFLEKHTDR